MAEFIDVQTNFSLGQLDTRLHADVEFEGFRKGLRVLENMVVTSEQGLLKRFGLELGIPMSQVEGDITADNVKIIILQTKPLEKLLVVFSPEKVNILQLPPNGSLKVIFTSTTPYTTLQVKQLRFAQKNGVLLIFHEEVQTRRIKPTPSPPAPQPFEFDISPFKNVPVFGFEEDTINDVTFTVKDESVGRNTTLTIIVPVGNNFIFTPDFIGGIFVSHGGVMLLKAPITGGGTVIAGDVIVAFDKQLKGPIPGKEAFISQTAINNNRGWPRGGVFFSSRLWLTGTKAIPNASFGSSVQDFFNFSTGTQNSGDPIDDILQAESLTFIKNSIGNRTLIIFTNDGPFATDIPLEGALSPTNTEFSLQGGHTIGDLDPVTLDEKVLFLNEGGKILWGMAYSNAVRGYSILNLSITASDLLNKPVSHAVFKGDPQTNASYELIVNEDGSMAALTSNVEAQINGWSKITTGERDADGNLQSKFKAVVGLGNFAYVLVERKNELFLERIVFGKFMDAFVEQEFTTPIKIVPGLAHLEGQVVEVIADGVLLPLETDPAKAGQPGSSIVKNAQIRLVKQARKVLAGLDYELKVIPLPISVTTAEGNDLYLKKTTSEIIVSYFDSLAIRVNGELLPGQEFSETDFINTLETKTGQDPVQVSGGYEPLDINITITQNRPLPVYIRALARKVELG